MVTEQEVDAIGQTLVDPKQPLQARFRALFTLRGLGGPGAIAWISQAFADDSALLKHELAYCLGQMQDARAIPVLVDVLQDTRQEPMVRHEAGEALGAIGDPEVLELLKQYSSDPVIEVTRPPLVSLPVSGPWEALPSPAPALAWSSLKPSPSLVARATIWLRMPQKTELPFPPLLTPASAPSPAGLHCGSALFRHEVGYVLGQLQHEAAVPQLAAALARCAENPMVRHECAEALGAIARPACLAALQAHADDPERVVRESCEVALDMYEHETGRAFQYADGLEQLHGGPPPRAPPSPGAP
ncbi:PREDICTED: deoxyhypusine hydroxylase [Rhinopithecus bieti]|uniref:deoxyhypusine hydroxylase n=1 Tax=Rhinopithecus bieti TaxID=61621 RepID=UPI00083BB5CC|nr:PREDICTED: deoxyhypusine hydroxylase [Rhinopithecus bieti]